MNLDFCRKIISKKLELIFSNNIYKKIEEIIFVNAGKKSIGIDGNILVKKQGRKVLKKSIRNRWNSLVKKFKSESLDEKA